MHHKLIKLSFITLALVIVLVSTSVALVVNAEDKLPDLIIPDYLRLIKISETNYLVEHRATNIGNADVKDFSWVGIAQYTVKDPTGNVKFEDSIGGNSLKLKLRQGQTSAGGRGLPMTIGDTLTITLDPSNLLKELNDNNNARTFVITEAMVVGNVSGNGFSCADTNPVCGADGKDYFDSCNATLNNVKVDYVGICKKTTSSDLPDLTMNSSSYCDRKIGALNCGQTISFTILNSGKADVKSYPWSEKINVKIKDPAGVIRYDKNFDADFNLNVGQQSQEQSITVEPYTIYDTLVITVDPKNYLKESNENNNIASFTVSKINASDHLPDFTVDQSVRIYSPAGWDNTKNYQLSYRLKNISKYDADLNDYYGKGIKITITGADGKVKYENAFALTLNLKAGESKLLFNPIPKDKVQAGDTLTIAVDTKNEIKETDETNNSISFKIDYNIFTPDSSTDPSALPDLAVEGIRLDTVNPKIGDVLNFSVSIKNNGDKATGEFETKSTSGSGGSSTSIAPYSYFLGSQWLSWGGYSVNEKISQYHGAGYYTYTLTLDPANKIKESDETNNTKTISVYVAAANSKDPKTEPVIPKEPETSFYENVKDFYAVGTVFKGSDNEHTDQCWDDAYCQESYLDVNPWTSDDLVKYQNGFLSSEPQFETMGYSRKADGTSRDMKVSGKVFKFKEAGSDFIVLTLDNKDYKVPFDSWSSIDRFFVKSGFLKDTSEYDISFIDKYLRLINFTCPNGYGKGYCLGETGQITTPEISQYLPRVAYWWGKVNQHVDLTTGAWQTDPDGVSGADLDMLTYCKKWYPKATSVKEYQKEKIEWFDAGNTQTYWDKSLYTNNVMSYQCVQGENNENNGNGLKDKPNSGGGPVNNTPKIYQPKTTTQAKPVLNSIKGKIVLQVEQNGEAYYTSPKTNKVYYLKDGNSAYQTMKETGAGINEADFINLVSSNPQGQALRKRFAGQIVLRVKARGEAYYINPTNLSVTYMPDGNAAYQIMKQQGVGISNDNLNKVIDTNTTPAQ
ncbi:MAG: hypothetical protein NTZ18_00935 [Candidatus Komeilibacteria bacterium]|nr:hypothetical protein [Candidatus Komeilibacteria bacterium]